MDNIEKAKREALLKQGWVEIHPIFDLEYIKKIGVETVVKESGYYLSKMTELLANNPFAFIGRDAVDAQEEFIQAICPPVAVPPAPLNTPRIQAEWPPQSYNDVTERAFEELTYRNITLIVSQVLGQPDKIYQTTDNYVFEYHYYEPFDFSQGEIIGKFYAVWEDLDVYLTIEPTTQWSDNGVKHALSWCLYTKDLRRYSSEALCEIGVELNPNTYQLGIIDPEFKLGSFPEYLQDYANDLVDKLKNFPERFNILIEGPPGYGKTRWTQAFAAEILAAEGYVVIIVDYSALEDLVLPDYLDKVCLIINDADTLALRREESKRGETEQILSWLDGTRSTFIRPFYLERRASIITILTANSVEKWDQAALRKGRIHARYVFDQVNLSELE